MAQLLELKRLKDLKVVSTSTTNGNILIDNVEKTVYTHPSGTNPHGTTKSDVGLSNIDNTSDINKPISTLTQTALNLKVDKIAGKSLISDTEITRLSGITSSATKVESSTVNGNIKINGVESSVYSQPLRKINSNWILKSGNSFEIIITKENMNDYIYIDNSIPPLTSGHLFLSVVLSDEVMAIDEGFTYEILYNNSISDSSQEIWFEDSDNNIIEIDTPNPWAVIYESSQKGQMNVTKNNGVYRYIDINGSIKLYTHTSNTSNPHKVTATQVGLDKVPNVSTNDQTPTYTMATNNTTLISGELLSTAFGKISKAINTFINNGTQTVFAGLLNNSLLTLKDVYINKNTCVTDHVTKPTNTYFTFVTPYEGIYEFDGRCTSTIDGSMTIDADIGTANLIKIVDKTMAIGETIRFNNTLMSLPSGYSITLVPTGDLSTKIDNVHFTIKYLGAR